MRHQCAKNLISFNIWRAAYFSSFFFSHFVSVKTFEIIVFFPWHLCYGTKATHAFISLVWSQVVSFSLSILLCEPIFVKQNVRDFTASQIVCHFELKDEKKKRSMWSSTVKIRMCVFFFDCRSFFLFDDKSICVRTFGLTYTEVFG